MLYKDRGRFLALAALLMTVCSCSLFEASECGEEGIYVTFSIGMASPQTKTYGPEYDTEEEESYINDLTFYMVKKGSGEYVKVKGSDVQWDPEMRRTGMIRIPSEKAGLYHVYVVTNSEGTYSYSDESVSALLSSQTRLSQSDCEKMWEANHFAMSNANDTFQEDFMPDVELIVGQHTADSPLNITVNLDRLACKVIPNVSSTCTCAFADLEVLGLESTYYAKSFFLDGVSLINCANSFNLFQHWEKGSQWASGGTPDGYPEMRLVSPSSSSTYSMLSGYYNRWADYVNDDFTINKSVPFSADGTPLFCLENNSPYYSSELAGRDYNPSCTVRTKMKGRTTGVVFRFQVGFASGLTPSGDDSPVPMTFFRYKGRYYADPVKLLADCPELGTDISVSQLRKKGVNVYEDGLMYYVYWIKDENYTDDNDTYYSVIRNTCYLLTVTKIVSPGDDIPGGHTYKETDPIDITETPITASLTIVDWDNRDIWLEL